VVYNILKYIKFEVYIMNILDYVKIETSTKNDGNMSYSYGEKTKVIENRKKFWEKKGFKYENTYQLQTDLKEFKVLDNVEVVNTIPQKFSVVSKTDVLITNNEDVVLALLTGDCLQTIAFEPKNKILALIHCGYMWQDAGIIDQAFKRMKKEFGVKAEDVFVYLGDCISPQYYRWDENIFDKTKKDSWIRKTIKKDNHPKRPYLIDLRKS